MDVSQSEPNYIKITSSNAQSLVEGILIGNGVSKENATIIAKCLVLADLRGVDTHGINRIPSYMARVRQRVLDPKATPLLTMVTPVVAQVSGRPPLLECGRADRFAR